MDWSKYAVIPYLRQPSEDADNRAIPLFPLWEDRWRLWIPTPQILIETNPIDLAEGGYIAKAGQRESDLFVPFLDFMWKHASWPDVSRWLAAVEMDTFRLAASLGKVDHFATCSTIEGRDSAMFVSTEIEYLLGRSRSLFDNLQKVIKCIWDRIVLSDEQAQRIKKQQPLADSFSDVAKKVRKREKGASPHGLPPALLACYDAVEEFFFLMKEVRDSLTHRAAGVGSVFVTERGYGVRRDSPLSKLGPPPKPEYNYNDAVISLAPILANVVCQSIYACNDFADAFATNFKLPDPIIDGYQVFLRAPHTPSLGNAQLILRGRNPWVEPPEQANPGA